MTTDRAIRLRRDDAWMLVGQLLLALAALFSLPLGARDGGGVSSILPPLRSTVPGAGTTSTAAADRRHADHSYGTTARARRIVRRRLCRRPHPPATPSWRPRIDHVRTTARGGPWQSRAPPPVC